MEKHKLLKEILTIILAALVLAIVVSFPNMKNLPYPFYSFLIIISLAGLLKKTYAYYLEADTKIKFWSMYQYGFKRKSHFKRPVPMVWVPLILAPIHLWWFGILETEIVARTERVSKRHGLYRFSEMTDWHIALINSLGIITTLFLAIIGYLINQELFSNLAIYYTFWSILPIGGLDGTKIFFGSRYLWTILAIFLLIIFGWLILIV
ncbi:hypothetical protein H8D91_01215 [archaeon]|nr:hypothetical protein [archaeon]